MAIKKKVPGNEQKIEKEFATKEAAQIWAQKQTKLYRDQGASSRYDVKLNAVTNQWVVYMFIYLD